MVALFLLMDVGLYVERHEVLALLGYGPVADQPVLRRPRVDKSTLVSDERMAQIRNGIVYHPAKGVQRGGRVDLVVTLDGKGVVDGIDVLGGQFDPAYAAAVQKAIRAAGPFPPQTARMFSLTFSDGGR